MYRMVLAEQPTLIEDRTEDTDPEPFVPPAALLQTGEWLMPCLPQSADAHSSSPGLPVRNTFIEFCDEAEDSRATRSMPHGMFRRELLAEVPETMATAPVMQVSLAVLRPGSIVVVADLVKLPAFNGCRGLVKSYDAEAERYTVKLFTAKGEQVAKLRRENLRHPSQLPSWQFACASEAPGQPALMLAASSPPCLHFDGSFQLASAVLGQPAQMLVMPPPPPSLASDFVDSFQLASSALGQSPRMLPPLPPPSFAPQLGGSLLEAIAIMEPSAPR
jgi:hypothetical protein